MQYTTREQGRRLVELGLPANTADLYYDRDDIKMPTNGSFGNKRFFEEYPQYEPSWSSDALLKVIPCPYQMTRGINGKVQFMLLTVLRHETFDTELEAVYSMVVMLLEKDLLDPIKLKNYDSRRADKKEIT